MSKVHLNMFEMSYRYFFSNLGYHSVVIIVFPYKGLESPLWKFELGQKGEHRFLLKEEDHLISK